MKKGFTLVELSIVLVIIGLLIGGILVAQSMIGTAKIQGLVRQVGQFDAAEANFETKYGQMPGDNNLIPPSGPSGGTNPAYAGNNNGYVEGPVGVTSTNDWGGEMAKYWSDLSVSGLTAPAGGSYVSDSAGVNIMTNTSTKLPAAVTGNAYFVVWGSSAGNYYNIISLTNGSLVSQVSGTGPYKPSDALAIDKKIDDGNPSAGNTVASENWRDSTISLWHQASAYYAYCTKTIGGSTYNLDLNSAVCSLSIQMGISAGNPK